MMQLTASEASPFVRKVRLTAALKGLERDIELVTADSDPANNAAVRAKNPLAKIPVLVLDDGTAVYDSHVICEYLDSLRPSPRLFPAGGQERLKTLTLAALCDGIAEAAILIVYEKRFRPEDKYVQSWIDKQQAKVDAGLDLLEQNPPAWGGHPDYGHIALAATLAFLDIRHAGKWRERRPKLVAWLDRFSVAVPAFSATMPQQ